MSPSTFPGLCTGLGVDGALLWQQITVQYSVQGICEHTSSF